MITQCPKTGKTCEVTGCNGCWKAEQAEQEPMASVRWGRYKECEWTATERLHELLGRFREGQTPIQLYAAPIEPVKQEPVAFMFKVKRTTKSTTVLDEFAAIDYFPQDNEEIVSKEPLLYAAPVDAKAIGLAIHYPDCWDTAAYPTLDSALVEIAAWGKAFRCTNDDCVDAKAILEELEITNMNLNCKSVQARLATSWGYVKAEQEPVTEALRLSEEAIEYARQGGKIGSGIYGKALSAIRTAKEIFEEAKTTNYMLGFSDGKQYAHKYEQAEQKQMAVLDITYGREPECYATPNAEDLPEGTYRLYAAPVQQAEQEIIPSWEEYCECEGIPCEPVKPVDLTDDEIYEVLKRYTKTERYKDCFGSYRAVIAADREKNK